MLRMLLLVMLLQELGTRAAPRDSAWVKRHEAFVVEAKKGGAELLLLGDSITDAWRGQKALWDERFAPLKAANFGMSGDCTQHLLWRLRNGLLDGPRPKAVMLLIGTNNLGWGQQSVESAAAGVEALVDELRGKTRILLLGVFPRGEKPDDPFRARIQDLNGRLAKLKHVSYLDLGPLFLSPDGTLSKELMPDFLHLSEKGYRVWADAVKQPLDDLLR
ncbi:MAG TPA: GDSL-type esterase/lipase family protein [Planctomycetota bacterium]